MQEGKIYVVECSEGSFDSFHHWIGGVFSNKEKAEECVEILERKVQEIKDLPYPCEVDEDGDPINYYEMTDEQSHEYNLIWSKKNEVYEWSKPIIKEYPLNCMLAFNQNFIEEGQLWPQQKL